MRRLGEATQLRFSYPLKLGAARFRVPVIDGVGADHLAAHEPWLSPVVALLLRERPGSTFVDIGANVGQTLLKVRAEHPAVSYVAFEPNPHCVHYLLELIRLNPSLQDVVVYPVGLGARDEILSLIVESETDSQATVIPNFRGGDDRKQRLRVAVVNAERVEHFSEPKLVFKIDVEGGELEVLLGLDALLRQRRPPVICEVLPAYDASRVVRIERQQRLERQLREWKYAAVRIPMRDRPTVVTEFGIHSNLDWTNYVLVPEEDRALTEQLLALELSPGKR